MNAVFTFKLSDLIAGLTRSNQWEWHGPCEAELMDRWNADLTVEPISECDLVTPHILSNFEKQPAAQQLQEELSAAQTNGTADATIVRKYETTLGVTIGLQPQRYELFRTFVTLHFGRPDLIGRISIISGFVGFAASSEGGLIIPNYNEFLEGRPYLILGDSSIAFSVGVATKVHDNSRASGGER
jgi:hypothetical protein